MKYNPEADTEQCDKWIDRAVLAVKASDDDWKELYEMLGKRFAANPSEELATAMAHTGLISSFALSLMVVLLLACWPTPWFAWVVLVGGLIFGVIVDFILMFGAFYQDSYFSADQLTQRILEAIDNRKSSDKLA
jgi:fatty acid desaturase